MHELFSPRAVVLVGVSRQSGVGAYNGLEMLVRYGYQGRIYVVHPQAEEILGHRVYPRTWPSLPWAGTGSWRWCRSVWPKASAGW